MPHGPSSVRSSAAASRSWSSRHPCQSSRPYPRRELSRRRSGQPVQVWWSLISSREPRKSRPKPPARILGEEGLHGLIRVRDQLTRRGLLDKHLDQPAQLLLEV